MRAVASLVCSVLVLATAVYRAEDARGATPTAVSSTPSPIPTRHANSTVTPAPAATPVFATELGLNIDEVIGLARPGATIRWREAGAGVTYGLSGDLFVVRANADDPLCTAAAIQDRRTITLNEKLPHGRTEFQVPFPPLPLGEGWFVYDGHVSLTELDAVGGEIGSQRASAISESRCSRPASPTASVTLPATGVGVSGGETGARGLRALGLAMALTGILFAGAGMWSVVREKSGIGSQVRFENRPNRR